MNKEVNSFASNPPPYHTFEVLGEFFLLDCSTGRAYKIDEPFYLFLKYQLEHSIEKVNEILLTEFQFPKEIIMACNDLFTNIAENGLIEIPSIDTNREEVLDALQKIKELPVYKMDLLLAEACNLACRYCFCRENNNQNSLMSKAVAKRAIDLLFDVSQDKNVSINFFGGEPLLNKETWIFALEYATEKAETYGKEVGFSMTTNATLLDDDCIELIKKYKMGIMVSLDGPQEIHDFQCPTQDGRGSFIMAKGNIDKLHAEGLDLSVRCTVAHPLPHLPSLIRFFQDINFKTIVAEPAINSLGSTSEADLTYEDMLSFINYERELLPDILASMFNEKRPALFNYDSELSVFAQAETRNKPLSVTCHAAMSHFSVSATGELYPCAKFVGSKPQQQGDVYCGVKREDSIKLWDEFSKVLNTVCSSCWAFRLCPGVCPAEFLDAQGNFIPTDSVRCLREKAKIENAAYLYTKYQERKQKEQVTP